MSASRARLLLAAALLPALGLACSPLLTVDGGRFDAISDRPGRTGVAVDLRVGAYNPAEEPSHSVAAGGTLGFRTKFSDALTQIALSEDFVLLPLGRIEIVTPFFRGGINAFQFESLDGSFAYGMFSPYAEGGILVTLHRAEDGSSVFFSAAAAIEYDLRFTDQPNEGYWMGLAGFGLGGPPWHPPVVEEEVPDDTGTQ